MMPSDVPIFICGTGRSGTTILQYLLSKHPRIFSLRYESRFIVHSAGLVHLLDHPDVQGWFASFKEKILGEWYSRVYRRGTPREYIGGLCSDIERDFIEELLDDLEVRLGTSPDRSGRVQIARIFIESMFASGMKELDKSRFLEKTPSNLLYMSQLLEIFPGAKLIHIIRDGRDVAASILANRFWPINPNLLPSDNPRPTEKTVRTAAIFWRDFLTYGMQEGRKLSSTAYLEVKMERLVTNPEEQLEIIFDHIEDVPDPGIARFLDPSRAHIGRWRDAFRPSDVEDFKEEAGDLLVELGYERDHAWNSHRFPS